VSMTYRREIELVFDAASFKSNRVVSEPGQQANTTIDLWYIAGNRELNPLPLTTEKEFFLQNIRDYCRCIPQSKTSINTLLNAVSASWKMALDVVDDIRYLNHTCPTEITKTSDTSIVVRSSLLLRPLETNVKLEFHVHLESAQDSIKVDVKPQCTVVYGERYNEVKMSEFLVCRITENEDRKSWADIVAELKARLLARGRK
jgi:kinetochore protein Spc7/SPC105